MITSLTLTTTMLCKNSLQSHSSNFQLLGCMMDASSSYGKESLFAWIDEFALSRPKRNFHRDFSDGVLVAEILHHCFPKLVDLHNYNSANGLSQKRSNWETLNRKVLSRLNCPLSTDTINDIAQGKQGAIECFLSHLKEITEGMPDVCTSPIPIEAPNKYLQPKFSPKQTEKFTKPEKKDLSNSVTVHHLKEPTVPAILYHDLQQNLIELKESNKILQAKLDSLEELLKLKDIRIYDLTQQVKQQQGSSQLKPFKDNHRPRK